MRKQLHRIVEKAAPGDALSQVYDYFIMGITFFSLVPLMFKGTNWWLDIINNLSVYLLFMDYVLRWMIHDYEVGKIGDPWAFIKYPFNIWAICDLLAILPTLGLLGRQFRILRMFRVVKLLHTSRSFTYVSNVFRKERRTLSAVLIISLAYIYISALAMFCYEPDTFDDFFEALYWATTALTTVGYGDVYPGTTVGRLISMISSLFGIAVIALPAGIITAGFMEEYNKDREAREAARKVLEGAAKTAEEESREKEKAGSEKNGEARAAGEMLKAAKARAEAVEEGIEARKNPEEIRKGGGGLDN